MMTTGLAAKVLKGNETQCSYQSTSAVNRISNFVDTTTAAPVLTKELAQFVKQRKAV